jgi:lipopolysaccharide/colanic/teichoic acid biosynthesis glycosyltransferase
MSLVGPRPDVPYAVEMYKAGWYERLAALPGITGAWQVGGRSEVSYPGMIRLDIDYVRERSLRLDLTILLKTVPVVLTRRGAC